MTPCHTFHVERNEGEPKVPRIKSYPQVIHTFPEGGPKVPRKMVV